MSVFFKNITFIFCYRSYGKFKNHWNKGGIEVEENGALSTTAVGQTMVFRFLVFQLNLQNS